MKILFAGTPATAVPSLHALVAAGHDVAAVLTRAPARAGRRHQLVPSAVHTAAEDMGIPVLTPATLKDPDIQAQIADLAPAAIAVVAYGLLVPKALLEVPTHGWINLHFSLLPAWRGAAPVQSAIAAGDPMTGACTFRIEAGLDTGPIFDRLKEPVTPTDTSGELLERLSHSGADLLVTTFARLEAGTAIATAQEGTPSYAPQITTADAHVRWNAQASEIDRLSRAHTPQPGPWTSLNGIRVKLGPLVAHPDITDLEPGQIHAGKTALVGTGKGAVELTTVAPAGKKAMNAADWLRGARLTEPARFDVED